MKSYLRIFVLSVCGIPFCSFAPYILRAWRWSPLDRCDFWFPLLAAGVTLFLFFKRSGDSSEKPDFRAFGAMALFLLLLGVAVFVFHITAAGILAAIAFWWSAFWLFFGWSAALRAMPVFALLALGCPSTTYWTAYLIGAQKIGALMVKFSIAGILTGLTVLFRFRAPRMKPGMFCWSACLAGCFAFWSLTGAFAVKSAPFLPDFHAEKLRSYVIRDVTPTPDERRFFGNSVIRKTLLADDFGSFQVIEVELGDDVSVVHPASHCLRGSGFRILSENPKCLYTLRGRPMVLTEIEAELRGGRILAVVWYSCKQYSVGNFPAFRTAWSRGTRWRTWQVFTEVGKDGETAARDRMRTLLDCAVPNSCFDR